MKITYLTHENLDKTAVAKAMMLDIAIKLSNKYQISMISASSEVESHKRNYTNNNINHSKFYRGIYGKFSLKDLLHLLLFSIKIISKIWKTDVVYVRSYPMMIYSPIFFFLRKKIIFDPRGLGFLELIDSGKVKLILPKRLLFLIERFFIAVSCKVICVSDLHKKYYEDNYGMKQKYEVIYNGTEEANESLQVANPKLKTIGYVGSLIKWHCPSRTNDILSLLRSRGYEFEFHCVTRDIEGAERTFNGQYCKKIYSQPYRQKPIKFDLGLCLIEDTLSKSACFPVKFAEYVAAETPVLYSKNVDVCWKLDKKYDLGFPVDLSSSDHEIVDTIIRFLFNGESMKKKIEIPREITQQGMLEKIERVLKSIF